MSLKRTKRISRAQLPRGLACVLLLGLGGAVGCNAYPTFRDEPINCSVEAEYEFDPNPPSVSFACYFAATPDASAGASPGQIEGEGLCGARSAQVLRSSHCNDWGSTCNGSNFGPSGSGIDRSTYEGVSFWARAPGNTSKGFTISLYDANTTDIGSGGNCRIYTGADGGLQGSTISAFQDPNNPGTTIGGAAIASRFPDECGNNRTDGFDNQMVVTSEWALYTIPFGRFTQTAFPNRVPNSVLTEAGNVPGTGLLTTELWSLSIRPPKEAAFEIWIAKLGFYKKVQTAGPDAGPDVAQM